MFSKNIGIKEAQFSLKEYLTMLAEAQGCKLVDDPEKADVVLTLTKPMSEKEVSLIDNNFFYDAPIEKAAAREREQEPAAVRFCLTKSGFCVIMYYGIV